MLKTPTSGADICFPASFDAGAAARGVGIEGQHHYLIISFDGRGISVVYKAEDATPEGFIALKFLPLEAPEDGGDPAGSGPPSGCVKPPLESNPKTL